MTKNLSYYRKQCDDAFSKYVRQRDADENGNVRCCTCGSWHEWKYLDCGHFMSRQYESTRFDEQNTGPQCKQCNILSQGKQFEFSIYLDNKYGAGTAQTMLMKSKMEAKRDRYDYQILTQYFKDKVKKLKG